MDFNARKLAAELIGTFLLVFIAVGVATLSFGFGFTGQSVAAGVVATAFAFGLVLLCLAYAIGPISGCHINPAVTIGFVVSGRMPITEAVGYWVAQFVGGFLGALCLWGIFTGADSYTRSTGLGTDGWGKHSLAHLNAGGAFGTEVILTLVFVFVILAVTSKVGAPGFAGLVIGLSLTIVHLIGIPLTGTSVNPARALGPALIVQGDAIRQVWLFIVAPFVGGALAALLFRFLMPEERIAARADTIVPETSAG